MENKYTFEKLSNIAEEYDVEISLIITPRKIKILICNDDEGHYIKGGFDNVIFSDIEKKSIEMKKKHDEKMKKLNKSLQNFESLTLPDNLFTKKCHCGNEVDY